jgi:hypothetical protein
MISKSVTITTLSKDLSEARHGECCDLFALSLGDLERKGVQFGEWIWIREALPLECLHVWCRGLEHSGPIEMRSPNVQVRGGKVAFVVAPFLG